MTAARPLVPSLSLLLALALSSCVDDRSLPSDTGLGYDSRDGATSDAVDPLSDAFPSGECLPGCHWDCFPGGGTVCKAGIVYQYGGGGSVPCCNFADPWPYPGPECTSGSSYTCLTSTCHDVTKLPYYQCLARTHGYVEDIGSVSTIPHLLKLYCDADPLRHKGDPCTTDADCRPAVAGPLKCNPAAGECAPATPAPMPPDFGDSCGLDVTDLYQKPGTDWLTVGKTCKLCHVVYDFAGQCLKQGCSIACQYDEDCPPGTVCVCVSSSKGTIQQVCAATDDRSSVAGRTAALKCPGTALPDAGPDLNPAVDGGGAPQDSTPPSPD